MYNSAVSDLNETGQIQFNKMSNSVSVLVITAIGLIIYSFYKWATQNNDFFKRKGITHFKPTFIVGNTADLFFQKVELFEFVRILYSAHPSEK